MPIEINLSEILKEAKCRTPNENSQVEKDECMLSFDTAFSPQGLYTNINSWKSYGRDYVLLDSNKTGQKVYLYSKKYKIRIPSSLKKDKNDNQKATKLGIGIDGGFSGFDSDFEIKTENNLCILTNDNKFNLINLSELDIPSTILESVNGIIACKGVSAHEDTSKWEEKQKESIHSEILKQEDLNNISHGRPSPNKDDWKCCACGKQENLWFNLSDGYIGCGRQQYDGTGGCGEAVRHYDDTGKKYPLAVKLGTITPKGADVWSYDEDDMVKNKNLAKHLEHFGIDIMKQEKYDKSMEEMELEFNKNFVFGLIIESGAKLEHIRAPGFIGLDNLGNSCYMNSVLQTVLSIDEVQAKYYKNSKSVLENASMSTIEDNFCAQFAKLCVGCLSDRYIKQSDENKKLNANHAEQVYGGSKSNEASSSKEEKVENDNKEEKEGIQCVAVKPRMIKRLIGKGHQDFSTNTQQDSVEYFRHFLEFMNRSERNNNYINSDIPSLNSLFKMKFEERLQCLQSNKVKYNTSTDVILKLDVNLNSAINKDDVAKYKKEQLEKAKDDDGDTNMNDQPKKEEDKDKVLPIIPFNTLISDFLCDQIVNEWLSPATNKKGSLKKSVHIETFPNYLAVQIQRYYINEAWVPQKHEVIIPIPEEINIENMRGKGIQKDEEELPSSNGGSASVVMQADQAIVSTLTMLGLGTENAAKRAALAVQNANADMAAAWLMEHMQDPNINDPIENKQAKSDDNNDGFKPDPNMVNELNMMTGFAKEYIEVALIHTKGDQARAADYLFSHDNLAEDIAKLKNEQNAQKNEKKSITDGKAIYNLHAIISHLGTATSHGHYVAHIKKNGQWYFYNDSKVAKSKDPPFKHGYLYIFKRKKQ